MTYRELIQLYKTGKLNKEDKEKVAADIERQEAIGEYLFDESRIPDMPEILEAPAETDPEDTDQKFLSMLRSSIRRAFIKLGITVGCIVLAILLCTIFLLPRAVSLFYYDPAEIVSGATNRMSLDLAVYSELFLPGCCRNSVTAESLGYGRYLISIPQTVSWGGAPHITVSGRLDQNRLTLYNVDVLSPPPGNAFLSPDGTHPQMKSNTGPAGTKEEAAEALSSMDEQLYYGYVSLEQLTGYEDVYQWLREKGLDSANLWFCVYTENADGLSAANIGFTNNFSGVPLSWDSERYPLLQGMDEEGSLLDMSSSETAETHFTSLLSYLRDYGEIAEMMPFSYNPGKEDLESMISYVEEHGLQLYGFGILSYKDNLLQLSSDPAVSYLWARPLS